MNLPDFRTEVPKDLPEHLLEEFLKWKVNPSKYEQLNPVITKILKQYINKKEK